MSEILECGSQQYIPLYLLNVNWLAEDVKTLVSGQALGHVPEKEPELP